MTYLNPAPICPKCGKHARTTYTRYGSRRNQCCGLHSWGSAPLSTPERLDALKECLRLFDRLWMEHLLFRADARARKNHAFRLLREEADLPRGRIMFGEMDMETLERVRLAIGRIIARQVERRARSPRHV